MEKLELEVVDGEEQFAVFEFEITWLSITIFVICSLGMLMNLLSGIVLVQPSMKSSGTILLLGLTFADFFHLFFATIFFLYFEGVLVQTIKLNGFPDAGEICRFFKDSSELMSIWFVVAISFQRFIVVQFPLKASTICTNRNLTLFSFILGSLCMGFALPALLVTYRWKLGENGEWGWEESDFMGSEYHLIYSHWGPSLVKFIIPYPILIYLNIAIFLKLKEARKFRDSQLQSNNNANASLESSITAMQICIVVCYTFSYLPMAIISASTYFSIYSITLDSLGILSTKINSAINFILYCCVARKYRRTFWTLLRTCLHKCKLTKEPPHPSGFQQRGPQL